MKERLSTGDRPTGPLHLGHYLGSLRNRVKYQESHECYFVIADLHTLTTRPGKEQIARMNQYIHHIVLDYLAAGIDPDRDEGCLWPDLCRCSSRNQTRHHHGESCELS